MSTSPSEDLVRSLYRLGLVQRAIARHALAELGSQGFTALAIVKVHGPVRIGEVARLLSVDLSVASRQIASLVTAGHVRREADPDDRRALRVSITASGSKVLSESHRRMVAAFDEVLGDWPDDEVSALAAGLDRLRQDFAPGTAAADRPQEVTG